MKYFAWLICLLLVTGSLMAQEGNWVFLNKDVSGMKDAQMSIVRSNDTETVIQYEVFGYFSSDRAVDGIRYNVVNIPGTSLLMEKGNPDLPKMTTLVALNDNAKPEIEVIEEDVDTIKLDDSIIPSKGHILRNTNPEAVGYTFSSLYTQEENKFYPAESFKLSSPFIFRDVRGVRVEFYPIRYNAKTQELKITKKIQIAVKTTNSNGTNVKSRKRNATIDREFSHLYQTLFANYDAMNQSTRYNPIKTTGSLLIIAADDFYNATIPFMNWKKKAGIPTEMVKMSEVGKTAADIYTFIKAKYDAGGLAYIHLVGDADRVPTLFGKKERAASDPCFTKLEGNDNVPDAIISRFSAATVTDVEIQVNRVIAYESRPLVGDAGNAYRRTMGIASNEGNPTDYERAEWLREALENYNYDKYTKIYAPSAYKKDVADAIHEGLSVINYIGHGSKDTWVTSRFSSTDVNALHNTTVWPVIWSVACVNGDFSSGRDCFAERWAKVGTPEAPTGAIVCFAASTNASWVPPCDMQTEIIKEQLCKEKCMTVGGQAINGVLKAMDIWGTTDSSEGNMLFEQYNIFGDATVLQRSDVPKVVNVKIANGKIETGVAGLRVTLYNDDMSYVATYVTNGAGSVKAEVPAGKELKCTVYGVNIVPVVDMVVK